MLEFVLFQPLGSPKKSKPEFSPIQRFLCRKLNTLQQRLKIREVKTNWLDFGFKKCKVNVPDRLLELWNRNLSGFPLGLLISGLNKNEKSKHGLRYADKMGKF